jgi:hypothetical protein
MKKENNVFRKLTVLATFSFSLAFARAPGTYYQLRTDLQKVSKKELIAWVNGLVKAGHPSRMVGAPGHEGAKNYLVEELKRLDPKGKIEVSSAKPDLNVIQSFYQKDFDGNVEGKLPPTHPDYQKWARFLSHMKSQAEAKKDLPVENIVWEKEGLSAKKVLIITAHYDTISHHKDTLFVDEKSPMPGANYNASGVAIALGLVKTLSQIDLNYSVKVVFLDWQGIGFFGSYLYAEELKRLEKQGMGILGVLNLEMLGQDTSYLDKTKKLGNMALYTRDNAQEVSWAKVLMAHGQKMTTKVDFELRSNGFNSSDNFRFQEKGFKTVTFSQNWEEDFNPKFYQTAQDTTETLNHDTLWNSYQYVGGAAIGTLLDLTK